MRFIIVILLTVVFSNISAASKSSDDLILELMSKLKALEQKQATYQQANHELASKLMAVEQKLSTFLPTNVEQTLKLARIEEMLATINENQEKTQQIHQGELHSLREADEHLSSAFEEEKQSQNATLEELRKVLQAKIEGTVGKCSSLKEQLIKFFSSVSSGITNQKRQRSVGYNSTAEEEDMEDQTESSNMGIKEVEEASIDEVLSKDNDISEAGVSPIKATLEISSTGGVSYIRWGRTSCEGNANALYTGYAAGKIRESNNQAGSELICLHSIPQWGGFTNIYRGYSPLSEVEYRFHDDDPFSKVNLGGENLANHDMPCTVCHVQIRSHQLMIPGRKSCPAGWTMEYWGYLVTSYYTHYGGQFQCVDQAPEGAAGGSSRNDPIQHVLAVELNCGALPCPPYFHGYEVACVVCSK